MKLKAIKQHYYEDVLILKGEEYYADINHGGVVVRRGICEDITPTAPPKKRTRKKKVEK